MPVSVAMIALSSQLVVAASDGVPVFDIARSCKLDLAATAGLSNSQSIEACIRDEQGARKQLGEQWSTFPASSKAECIPQRIHWGYAELCQFAGVPADEPLG